ncbi:MAG: ATP-dependent Clp protease proteolytic subunit [Elusimicrobiota bacterium]|nr:ATP-dependent Clp protease proteolytic subunit [Elusimicrobiota bacterium]
MKYLLLSLVMSAAVPVVQAQVQDKPAEADAQKAKPKTKFQQLNDEKDELKAQYDLIIQAQRTKAAQLEAEYNRITMENKFSSEKQQTDLKQLKADLEKAATENKLAEEQLKILLGALNTEFLKISLENKLAAELNRKMVSDLDRQISRLKLENDLKAEKQRDVAIADAAEKSAIDLEMKRLDLKERQFKIDKLAMDSRADKLNSDLAMRSRKEEWKRETNTEPVYMAEPYKEGQLVISDRRIALNGPIFNGSADFVTDRIHYFNNISSAPVFIIIDSSPGGSVMAGYRILKAMQGSKAPVYVAVKSFAASMAAVITTLAEKSYVYPNAIILHHQMSTMNWGNMTQLKEQLDLAKEWERRLVIPVAKKIGIDMETFRKKMYEKNSDGDWEEFGDKAVDYKWATSVVERIDETGLVKNPDAEGASMPKRMLEEKEDEKGQRYVSLPRLQPFDFYFIYNPDKYYR